MMAERTFDDPRDRPRCDVHGTALERVDVTLPTGQTVTSWRCVFCDIEVDESGSSGGPDER